MTVRKRVARIWCEIVFDASYQCIKHVGHELNSKMIYL